MNEFVTMAVLAAISAFAALSAAFLGEGIIYKLFKRPRLQYVHIKGLKHNQGYVHGIEVKNTGGKIAEKISIKIEHDRITDLEAEGEQPIKQEISPDGRIALLVFVGLHPKDSILCSYHAGSQEKPGLKLGHGEEVIREKPYWRSREDWVFMTIGNLAIWWAVVGIVLDVLFVSK